MSDVLDLLPPGDRLARPDLAEQALEGLVHASAYRKTEPMHCRVAVADIVSDGDARIDQLLHGEAFDVLDRANGRVWGRARRDGVVGWVVLDSLSAGAPLATRRVAAVDAVLPLNALVVDTAEGLAGELGEADLQPVGDFERDPVAVAERLLGRPHEPGARSSISTDCSGLVQQALLACGRACPRDTDQQEAAFEAEIPRSALRRGDLVFWRGHVGMMLDAERMIHANAHHMAVAIEPLDAAIARIDAAGSGEPTSFRRP